MILTRVRDVLSDTLQICSIQILLSGVLYNEQSINKPIRLNTQLEFLKLQVNTLLEGLPCSYVCTVRKQSSARFKQGKDKLTTISDHVFQERM